MKWTYKSIQDHEGYKKAYATLTAIEDEIDELENETIPKLEAKAEELKKESLKSDKVTWQDVEQVRHDIEKLQYRLKTLYEKQQKQQQKLEEQAEKARAIIVKEAEQKKIKALQKSLQAYEMLAQAYEENKEIDRYQAEALQLTGRDLHRAKAKIPVELPNPAVQNVVWDIWLKKAYKFLESKGIKKSS